MSNIAAPTVQSAPPYSFGEILSENTDKIEVLHTQRTYVCHVIGQIVENILMGCQNHALVVFGGDTLIEIVNRIIDGAVYPVDEIVPGVVVSMAKMKSGESICIVGKSGGFGDENILALISDYLLKERAEQ